MSTASPMPTRRLGGSGLYVSELGLGAMSLTIDGKGGWDMPAADKAESFAILDAYVAAGGNFIDTADAYATSELVIGAWLATKDAALRRSLIIATKYAGPTSMNPNDKGASRKHIMDAVDSSLRRLQIDYIDLFQQHTWCSDTPLEETMYALHDLVRSGKVRYVGICNLVSWQLNEVNHIARQHYLTPFVTLQQQYSLLCRTLEWDVLDVLVKDNVGVLAWSPLAGGWLTGRITRRTKKEELPAGSRTRWAESIGWSATSFSGNADERAFRILDELELVANAVGQPVAAVALRWLLHKEQVSSVLIGARTLQQLRDNLKASSFTLTNEQMARLDAVSAPESLPYPWSMQSTVRAVQAKKKM